MNTEALLTKWRHLIEPETSGGLTPLPWEKVLKSDCRVHESRNSVLVTRDSILGGRMVRSIWVAAGNLTEVLDLVDQVEREARRDGIKAIVFMGRRGWIRAAKGYSSLQTVGIKEL